MECQEVSQDGNILHVKFKCTLAVDTKMLKIMSSEYLCGALYTEFEFTGSRCMTPNNNNYADYYFIVSVRFQKLLEDDDFVYTCKLTGNKKELFVNELMVYDNQWHQIAFANNAGYSSNTPFSYTFDITLKCEIPEGQCVFTSIYDDTESTDFKLCCDDGSVPVHKAILAAHSPVLQKMVTGVWKESKEGKVKLQGVSLEILQHLKDYMYLNRLPKKTGLQELCVLASYYMMPRLVVQCSAKLLNHLTIDNAIEVAEFASRYRVEPLYIAILKTMRGENAKIDKLVLKHKTNWDEVCKKINSAE